MAADADPGEERPLLGNEEEEAAAAMGPVAALYFYSLSRVKQTLSALPLGMEPESDLYGFPWDVLLLFSLLLFLLGAVHLYFIRLRIKKKFCLLTEAQLVDTIRSHMEDKSRMASDLQNLQAQLQEKDQEIKDAIRFDSTSEEIEELQSERDRLTDAREKLQQELSQVKEDLEEAREKEKQYEKEFLEQTQKAQVNEESTAAMKAQIAQANDALEEAERKAQGLEERIYHIDGEMKALNQRKQQVEQEKAQLMEQIAELQEQMSLMQRSIRDLNESVTIKDREIETLKESFLQLKELDSDSEDEGASGEEHAKEKMTSSNCNNGGVKETRKDKVKNLLDATKTVEGLMNVARLNTKLKIAEEEKKKTWEKLAYEMKSRKEVDDLVKGLQSQSESMNSEREEAKAELQRTKQQLEIATQMFHEKEMDLQRRLMQEELQREQREQAISAADEKMKNALEEASLYRKQVQDIKEELEKTERSYKTQLSANDHKAHNNWVAARQAERELLNAKREASNLRQRVTDMELRLNQERQGQQPRGPPSARRGPPAQEGSLRSSPSSSGRPSPPLGVDGARRPVSSSSNQGFQLPLETSPTSQRAPRPPQDLPPAFGPVPPLMSPTLHHRPPMPQGMNLARGYGPYPPGGPLPPPGPPYGSPAPDRHPDGPYPPYGAGGPLGPPGMYGPLPVGPYGPPERYPGPPHAAAWRGPPIYSPPRGGPPGAFPPGVAPLPTRPDALAAPDGVSRGAPDQGAPGSMPPSSAGPATATQAEP
ncbi:transport and Golgi organization protein 1 homolog isoform X1 [Lampetra planeri]